MSRASPLVALSIACATLAVLLASVSTGVLAQPSGGGGAQQMDLGALFGALGAMQGGGGAGGGVGGKQGNHSRINSSSWQTRHTSDTPT